MHTHDMQPDKGQPYFTNMYDIPSREDALARLSEAGLTGDNVSATESRIYGDLYDQLLPSRGSNQPADPSWRQVYSRSGVDPIGEQADIREANPSVLANLYMLYCLREFGINLGDRLRDPNGEVRDRLVDNFLAWATTVFAGTRFSNDAYLFFKHKFSDYSNEGYEGQSSEGTAGDESRRGMN